MPGFPIYFQKYNGKMEKFELKDLTDLRRPCWTCTNCHMVYTKKARFVKCEVSKTKIQHPIVMKHCPPNCNGTCEKRRRSGGCGSTGTIAKVLDWPDAN